MSKIKQVARATFGLLAKVEPFEVATIACAGAIGKLRGSAELKTSTSNQVVDAVYLWVNDQDPAWQLERAKHAPSDAKVDNTDGSETAKSRFRQFGELAASINMLTKHAEFIRNVYIVVAGQRPQLENLNVKLPFNLVIVNHQEFMPAEDLPTFSSRAITANLHRIEGIAENFLYMNDDVFVTKPSAAETWFKNGKAQLRYSAQQMPAQNTLAANEVVYNARYKTIAVANAKGWNNIDGQPQHGPHPIIKSVMQKLWQECPDEMRLASHSKFRTAEAILPEWLHNLAARSMNAAEVVSGDGYKYIAINQASSLLAIVHLLINRGKFQTVCLNDVAEVFGWQSLNGDRLARRVERVLKQLA